MNNESSQPSSLSASKRPVLSLILCSRNDQYMGNSLWRLQTVLNYTAKNIVELGFGQDVEIKVADWGSETPLHKVLDLRPEAAGIVSFVVVPPALASNFQMDSEFAEVLALNSAARRSEGAYIGRIDQDTLVGKNFLRYFFGIFEGSLDINTPLDSALIWSNRRRIPYRFSSKCCSLSNVGRFIEYFGKFLSLDDPGTKSGREFFNAPVGILLLNRHIWEKCGGMDEKMTNWGFMEIDMIYRLRNQYNLVHLEDHVECDFYHLEHYDPLTPRITNRKMNPKADNNLFNPNGNDWGLREYTLEIYHHNSFLAEAEILSIKKPQYERIKFIILLLITSSQLFRDYINIRAEKLYILCKRRLVTIYYTIMGKPFKKWPGLIKQLWVEKETRKKRQKQFQ